MFPVINSPYPPIPPAKLASCTHFLALIILLFGAALFGLTFELAGVLSGRTRLDELTPLLVFYGIFVLIAFASAREHFGGISLFTAILILIGMQVVQLSMHKSQDGKRLTPELPTYSAEPYLNDRSPRVDPLERRRDPQRPLAYSSETPRRIPHAAGGGPSWDRQY